ncbi:ABC transporter permease, partial [candidate division KSB1 bacterium]|nr:ABC transporter permease [candidate division KSB1 bacterium]
MLEIAIGTLSATLCILILARFEKIPQQRFCGMALVIAALIYLGFGIFASNMNWLLIEFGGLVIFLTLAILGIRKSVWFLALGWLTHIIWDVALHSEAPFVPEWYPLACVSFDLIIGFYIAFRLTSKQSLSNPWLWKMAWRDSRTHRKRLFLFMTSIVMGIAALVSIGSFGQTLEKAMDDQAKTLLGADLMFSSLQPFTPEIEAFIDSIGGEQAREWLFISMAYFPKTQESRLVQVRSLKGDFPFYGEIATDPKAAVNNYKAGPNALVDNVLMLQYHATPGDSIKIGATTFNIAARITKTPNNPAIASTFNPRVFIPPDYLEETNLIQRGSLVRYRVYFKFDDDRDVEALVHAIEGQRNKFRLRIDTVKERLEDMDEVIGNLYRFLGLVGFVALILGSIGVGSAVHVYIRQKLENVSILRCLGADSKQAFLIYLIQVGVMALLGSFLGAILGMGIQFFLPNVLRDFLPVEVGYAVSWPAVLQGMSIGLVLALLFALLPLLSI